MTITLPKMQLHNNITLLQGNNELLHDQEIQLHDNITLLQGNNG
jgi:hypothetical protein